MNRRILLKNFVNLLKTVSLVGLMASCYRRQPRRVRRSEPVEPRPQPIASPIRDPEPGEYRQQSIQKAKNFETDYPDDLTLDRARFAVLKKLRKKLLKIQNWYGHGRFNVMSFGDMLSLIEWVPQIPSLQASERALLHELFERDAKDYGFFGTKVISNLSDSISKKDVVKIPGSGQYLFKGQAYKTYKKLRNDVGPDLILTSGIRGIVKQYYLFINKAIEVDGNLSRAARSIAPPGYSFHANGDFDVGRRGLGALNFTDQFSKTPEFKKLIAIGYIDLRYENGNRFGVRYEPWHIKVSKI